MRFRLVAKLSTLAILTFRGLRNSLGYFSHVKHLTIDIDIDIGNTNYFNQSINQSINLFAK